MLKNLKKFAFFVKIRIYEKKNISKIVRVEK